MAGTAWASEKFRRRAVLMASVFPYLIAGSVSINNRVLVAAGDLQYGWPTHVPAGYEVKNVSRRDLRVPGGFVLDYSIVLSGTEMHGLINLYVTNVPDEAADWCDAFLSVEGFARPSPGRRQACTTQRSVQGGPDAVAAVDQIDGYAVQGNSVESSLTDVDWIVHGVVLMNRDDWLRTANQSHTHLYGT